MEHDVLDRFYKCAKKYGFDIIIRVNGENPMIQPFDILDNLDKFISEKRFIYGNHSWVFNMDMLEDAKQNSPDAETREHVVRRFFNSVDYPEDLDRIEALL